MYRERGEFNNAIRHYTVGLKLAPNSPNSYNNLATIYKDFGRLAEAMDCYKKALELDGSQHWLYNNIGVIFIGQGKTDEAAEWFQKCLALKSDFDDSAQNYLMSLNYTDKLSPVEIFNKHRDWGKEVEARMSHRLYKNDSPINRDRKIRIGYVSADFWQHAVGNFIEPALAVHNQDDFEITCYSDVDLTDISTEGLKKLVDKWHDIHELNNDEVAELVVADGIDILVDLGGHMGKSRLPMFARKPAPIQVTYLGYPNTTGLNTIDYRITDNIADPEGKTDHLNTETLIRLPNCFLCYAPPPEELPINDLPFLKNGYITFASFNNRPKITDKVIACWAEILHKVPKSRLILKSSPLRDEGTREKLLDKFTALGIDRERIEILLYAATYAAHMQLYNQADIALDTFPYNGTTTTFEALWMGVPVVAIAGESHVSRVSASILSQIGQQDLITNSQEEYTELAVKLANDPERLAKLRQEIRPRLHTSPACDRWGFTRDLENSYREMVAKWNREITPAPDHKEDNGQELATKLVLEGEQLYNDGHHSEAITLFEKALTVVPDHETALNNLGVIHWQNDNPQEAIQYFQKAVIANPSNLNAIDNLSEALATINKESQKPDTPASSAPQPGTDDPAEEINLSGEDLFAENKLDEAAQAFTKALEINPEHVSALNNLGVIHWQKGNTSEAINYLKKALTIDPAFLPAIDNLKDMLQAEMGNSITAQTNKPTIRILHNLARSGGTLLSKCLGCMQDTVLLSEIHPLGVQWFNPLQQAWQWFQLFSQEEVSAIKQQGGLSFSESIELIYQKCQEQGKNLIIRDWSHLDFMAAPFLDKPTNRVSINEVLADKFQIKEFNTTRHPIDQWLSLSRLSVMQGKISLESFLAGYHKFAQICAQTGFIRYEDFIDDPTAKMQELCNHLDVPYDPSFIDKWWNYTTISGDTKSARGSKKEILRVPRYPVADELLAQFAANPDYQASIAILGYNHPQ